MTGETRRQAPIHRLGKNHAERVPRRLLALAVEAETEWHGDDEQHTLTGWHLSLWAHTKNGKALASAGEWHGSTADELTETIIKATRSDATTWLYAHNLGYALALTWIPDALTAAGWELTQHALTADSPWARFRKGHKRLVLADSASLLPVRMAAMASWQPTIDNAACKAQEYPQNTNARPRASSCVLGASLVRLIEWWTTEHMGSWSVSGAANGWHMLTHKHLRIAPVMKPDDAFDALERRAITGGYHMVSQVGRLHGGPYAEIDLAHAYASVGWQRFMPAKRLGTPRPVERSVAIRSLSSYDVICECRIKTERAVYPVKVGGRVWYPTGEFDTVLCGPELREAERRGELVDTGYGAHYRMSPWLSDFSGWMVAALDGDEYSGQPEVLAFLKGISRSVYGRVALRTSEVVARYPVKIPGWHMEHGVDLTRGAKDRTMILGGMLERSVMDAPGDNSLPAVLAFIQSYLRLELVHAIECAGGAVRQCNTDGMLVDLEALRRQWEGFYGPYLTSLDPYVAIADELASRLTSSSSWGDWRVKRFSQHAKVMSYQHVELDTARKFSGIPGDAAQVDDTIYRFYTWPKLRSTLESGDGAGYLRHGRQVDLATVAPLGWVYESGMVYPAVAYIDDDGATRLAGRDALDGPRGPLAARWRQHRQLQPFVNEVASVHDYLT